jgi:RecB family exonuclease
MQQRMLVRARGLAAFRRALVDLCLEGSLGDVRRRMVLVPTRAAAELLRQSVEDTAAARGRPAAILPDIVTRDEWIARLHGALPGTPPLLTRLDREVLLIQAARRTANRRRLGGAPFPLRPGLVRAMLDFYDELKRRQRTIRRFAHALFEDLKVEHGFDRGSEGLLAQTCFLAFSFLAYEHALDAVGRVDEHRLRARLLAEQPALGTDHLVVAVADHPADLRGLWPADFDLIGRLSHLARVDVVMTDEAHDAGFRERVETELPGIEERRASGMPASGRLVAPAGAEGPVSLARDREDELRRVARAIRASANHEGRLEARTAVVFHRPLPYLYLAQQVLTDAGIPYQAFDALPLAAEPYAALLDLTLAVARTGGTRDTVLALLRSPLVTFEVDDEPVTLEDAAALEAALADRRAAGGSATFPSEIDALARGGLRRGVDLDRARRAARAAAAVAAALEGYCAAPAASGQVETIAIFLRQHERPPSGADSLGDRHRRARAAVLGVLDGLAAAFRVYGDERWRHEELSALLHHAIEAHTFAPRRGRGGVHLVDAAAARFGDFDVVHLVGLVDADWPERARRTIFYTPSLLAGLGWPQARDVTEAQQAAFRDVLSLAREQTWLWAFQFEGDTAVAVSPLVEYVRDAPVASQATWSQPLFPDELFTGQQSPFGLPAAQDRWLSARRRRPALDRPEYSGAVVPQPPRAYRVSAVDRYVDCPFKYFAESVLGLAEERDEMAGLTPLERGSLLHGLFERFYAEWDGAGRGAITAELLPAALAEFSRLAAHATATLPEADRALERTRLLGSLVARGVAERVFELEVNAGQQVARRLLERELRGTFVFPYLQGLDTRAIEIRGKADRIDVLHDGSIRVIDYKLGRLPEKWSVQAAVYAHCASQRLQAETGRPHPVSAAMYLAFGDDRRLEGLLGSRDEPVALAVETRASEFARAVQQIEAGEFPPRPRRSEACQWCGYAGVCRKEYRVEDDEAADAV